jgi:hypothetical protein
LSWQQQQQQQHCTIEMMMMMMMMMIIIRAHRFISSETQICLVHVVLVPSISTIEGDVCFDRPG